MNVEEKLKELITSRFRTVKEFSRIIDLPYGTVDSILRRGVANANITNIIKICKELEISADALADGEIVPTERKEKKPISFSEVPALLDYLKSINDHSGMTIDGKPLTEIEAGFLFDAIESAVNLIKRSRERKEK